MDIYKFGKKCIKTPEVELIVWLNSPFEPFKSSTAF